MLYSTIGVMFLIAGFDSCAACKSQPLLLSDCLAGTTELSLLLSDCLAGTTELSLLLSDCLAGTTDLPPNLRFFMRLGAVQ